MKRILMTNIFCFGLFKYLLAQAPGIDLEIAHLTGDFYIFTTYNEYQGQRIPANGLYLTTDSGAVMIDSPWDTTQFQPLLDSIFLKHHKKVVLCIATHFHEDRTGGLAYYSKQGIRTYTTTRTDALSKSRGMNRAGHLIERDTVFSVGGYSFQTFYPGPGHTPDNIVIWFKDSQILYGGCLIKSVQDNTLGNLADANIGEYASTIKKVIKKCKNPKFVIPGHSDWTNTKSLLHTLNMAQKLRIK